MTAKRIIAIVLSALLLAVSVFSLVWGIINFNKVKEGFKGSGLYTQTDIDAAYEDGYGEALGNKQEYEELIAEYRDKLADYEIIKKELAVSKDNINELNEKVYSLQTYIAECETLIDKMKAENHRLQSQIKNLENINANLMQSVNAYIQLISSISLIEERFVVTFMFDDTVYSILLVPDGEKVQIENPQSTEYTIFLGWSLSLDGELVDLNEIEITADTVIYAKIIRKYDVNFILDYAVYEHHIVEKGDTITAKTPPSTMKRVFKGWSLDSVNVIDVTDFPIMEHRTFFAVVETRHEVRFVYTRHYPYLSTVNLSTQYVVKSDMLQVPVPPVFNGYYFDGWLLNGTSPISDPTNCVLTGDVVFTAKYMPMSRGVSYTQSFYKASTMLRQTNVIDYLKNNGYSYITNMQMLIRYSVTVRLYVGNHSGRIVTLDQSYSYIPKTPCESFDELMAKGTLLYSLGLTANGDVQLFLSFEGSSLLSNSVFDHGSAEIISASFTMRDF